VRPSPVGSWAMSSSARNGRLSMSLGAVRRGSRGAAVLSTLTRLGRSLALPGSWSRRMVARPRALLMNPPFWSLHPGIGDCGSESWDRAAVMKPAFGPIPSRSRNNRTWPHHAGDHVGAPEFIRRYEADHDGVKGRGDQRHRLAQVLCPTRRAWQTGLVRLGVVVALRRVHAVGRAGGGPDGEAQSKTEHQGPAGA
jgi:hypothetical protein